MDTTQSAQPLRGNTLPMSYERDFPSMPSPTLRFPPRNSSRPGSFQSTYPDGDLLKENLDHVQAYSGRYSPLAIPSPVRTHGATLAPVHGNTRPNSVELSEYEAGDEVKFAITPDVRSVSRESEMLGEDQDHGEEIPVTRSIPFRQRQTTEATSTLLEPQSATLSSAHDRIPSYPTIATPDPDDSEARLANTWDLQEATSQEEYLPLQYHHIRDENSGMRLVNNRSPHAPIQSGHPVVEHSAVPGQHLAPTRERYGTSLPRPLSGYSSSSDYGRRGRTRSPQLSPHQYVRRPSANSSRSPDSRPLSYAELLNISYPQPSPIPMNLDNAHLREAIGVNASLLSSRQTFEMYRANVKKTSDMPTLYEFATFMVQAANELAATEQDVDEKRKSGRLSDRGESPFPKDQTSRAEILREARQILQRLCDKSYPFAQYYLADGYFSGLFSKGSPDYDRAFPLFVAASKHGHAEAGYRAALCYEFGWGTKRDYLKAVQFYRQSASKNHPGAMLRLGEGCLKGTMGLTNRYREGIKWLKRAAEAADFQYNSAPYELGLLHEKGYGDDVFQDESYAAQLFTQSADLGHAEANYRLGDAYEHGHLHCPRDPALSVHFYTGAAQRGHTLAMMSLCAWYLVGADPVLEKDENEAYEWAKKAAEGGKSGIETRFEIIANGLPGLPKAEYAVGYFTEMGIGCRRDPLEANVWYVRAADSGDERAKHRIAAIRTAASGGTAFPKPMDVASKEEEKAKAKKWHLF